MQSIIIIMTDMITIIMRAHLHAANDHSGDNLAGVAYNHVLSSVHVQGGHARGSINHAQPGQTLHTYAQSAGVRAWEVSEMNSSWGQG